MLDWRRADEYWFGNGFRIHRMGPARWELEEHAGDGGSVIVDPEPIAALPTLAACKHKAETLHTRRRVALLRRRLTLIGLGGWVLALLGGHPVVFLAAGVVGSAALLELIMTYVECRNGGARELTQ
ncbi:MAG TPA: hypothetical protein VMP13_04835 [Acidimicrobiia bacterium]|nr:hypothetical protein [Acidimicrobiia bacterium]